MSVAGHSARARLLVVSAHAADFVWRAGGYIALTTAAGGEANVVCLSFGERGESQGRGGDGREGPRRDHALPGQGRLPAAVR